MYRSPSHLPEDTRVAVSDQLNARLADGLDLHSQIKVAHWNIKGPQFAALHPLFETFAIGLANHNDTIAERARTLPARAAGPNTQTPPAGGAPPPPPPGPGPPPATSRRRRRSPNTPRRPAATSS